MRIKQGLKFANRNLTITYKVFPYIKNYFLQDALKEQTIFEQFLILIIIRNYYI